MHVEPATHDSEHDPVQCNVHIAPPSQLMLPLAPTVTSQVEPPLQLTLQDSPHEPVQSFMSTQARVQLDALHVESPIAHEVCAGHVHEVPVHCGGGVSFPPHPTTNGVATNSIVRMKLFIAHHPNASVRAIC